MRNIGIINCYNVSKRCSSSGCLKAFYARTGAFEKYKDEDAQVISFVHCNGCSENSVEQIIERAERMKKVGVDSIHLSSCVKSKCPWYDTFMEELSKEFTVEGYTHKKK